MLPPLVILAAAIAGAAMLADYLEKKDKSNGNREKADDVQHSGDRRNHRRESRDAESDRTSVVNAKNKDKGGEKSVKDKEGDATGGAEKKGKDE